MLRHFPLFFGCRLLCLGLTAGLLSPVQSNASEARVGWNFDTGPSAEKSRELLVTRAPGRPPSGSWIRLRGIEAWALDAERVKAGQVPARPGAGAGQRPAPRAETAKRREDLTALQTAGFRLVAILRWGTDSWKEGVRAGGRDNRLSQDLREPFERCRYLAATYGDLIDFWEIDNEPDISFVQENPETYAAFLKACYWGIRRGAEDGGRRSEGGGRTDQHKNPSSVLRPLSSSRVLMAPLALPPGPYFEAFVRNEGLSYTDGFNYHFYGYAEDFAGMYRQFEAAIAATQRDQGPGTKDQGVEGQVAGSKGQAVLRTNFYPSADGWRGEVTAGFDHAADDVREQMEKLVARPHAAEEPAMARSGRWLVTGGVTVEETPDGWRFRVEGWPAGSLRAPSVELPLPAWWSPGSEALISFEYRIVPQEKTVRASDVAPVAAAARKIGLPFAPETTASDARGGLPASGSPTGGKQIGDHPTRWPERELPVFLTEYGYGGLGKVGRKTTDGRARQAAFFESVTDQIKELGIEGAMAFLLVPYLERDLLEFGLLMDADGGPRTEDGGQRTEDGKSAPREWGNYIISPALERLLARADETFEPKRWRVRTPPVCPVVIDFIAAKGLGLAKSFSGYFLEGEHGRSIPGEADLAVYNFGPGPVSGALELEGDSWTLPHGGRAAALTLHPGERRFVRVHVRPTAKRFVACPVTARFVVGGSVPAEPAVAPGAEPAVGAAPVAPPAVPPRVAPMPPAGAPVHTFEAYFRTENGNLYQTWPRLVPVENWQVYMQRWENFTPAFYGRHALPWRFAESRPVSLVFHFHPEAFPAVFEVRRAQMVRFFKPEDR